MAFVSGLSSNVDLPDVNVSTTFVSSTMLTVSTPASATGFSSVEIAPATLAQRSQSTVQFRFDDVITVTSLLPATGFAGSLITVVGTNFISSFGLRCKFGQKVLVTVLRSCCIFKC